MISSGISLTAFPVDRVCLIKYQVVSRERASRGAADSKGPRLEEAPKRVSFSPSLTQRGFPLLPTVIFCTTFSHLTVWVRALLPLVSDRDPLVTNGSPVLFHWTRIRQLPPATDEPPGHREPGLRSQAERLRCDRLRPGRCVPPWLEGVGVLAPLDDGCVCREGRKGAPTGGVKNGRGRHVFKLE